MRCGLICRNAFRRIRALLQNDIGQVRADHFAVNDFAVDETHVVMTVPAAGRVMKLDALPVVGRLQVLGILNLRRPLLQFVQSAFNVAANIIERVHRHVSVTIQLPFADQAKSPEGRRVMHERLHGGLQRVQVIRQVRFRQSECLRMPVGLLLKRKRLYAQVRQKIDGGTTALLQ